MTIPNLTILRWAARVLGGLSLAFLLFMVVGHLFSTEDQLPGGFQSARELAMFLCFPVSTIIGLSLAWKWEGLGGLITVAGVLCFHLVGREFSILPWIDGLAVPGLLFLAVWLWGKKLRDEPIA